MNKYKKYAKLLSLVGLLLLLTGITYSFFNYTRTGASNTISVGRISFVTNQSATINLTNVFPIDREDIDTDTTNVDEVVIEITGDTDYVGGIEYLVSSVDSSIYTSSGGLVPISLDVEVDDLGTSNANYFTARENTNESIYKQLIGNTLAGDQMLLVGYIVPNTTSGTAEGIDGSITIKAFFDNEVIAISDTYDGNESDLNGTTNEWVDDRYVLTTSEWNTIQTNGVSFKIKVEANEGIWVNGSLEEIMKQTAVMDNINSTYVNNVTPGIDFSIGSSDTNGKGVYIRKGTENDDYPIMYYRGDVDDNNVLFEGHCWQMVRTTDTGGVKLIYNGELSGNKRQLTSEDYGEPILNTGNYIYDATDNSWNISLNTTVAWNAALEMDIELSPGYDYVLEMSMDFSPQSGEYSYLGFYINDDAVTSVHAGTVSGVPLDGDLLYLKGSIKKLVSGDIIKFKYYGTFLANSTGSSGKIKIYRLDESLGLSCDNTGILSYLTLEENNVSISELAYNNMSNSPAYSGYMYGNAYVGERISGGFASGTYFGSGFTWDGNNYKLTDATVTSPDATHHYSCNLTSPDGTCSSILYVYSYRGTYMYFAMTLTGGVGIEEAFDKMFENVHDSNIKSIVEDWYEGNMSMVTNKLEDTIWCNDRSIVSYGGFLPTNEIDGNVLPFFGSALAYGAFGRSSTENDINIGTSTPSLLCPTKRDSFTWKSSKGNQKLSYPVALLTEDELMLAGGSTHHSYYFLSNSTTAAGFWSMSPGMYINNSLSHYVSGNYVLGAGGLVYNRGVRPVISLKPGQLIKNGTGTVADPYIID